MPAPPSIPSPAGLVPLPPVVAAGDLAGDLQTSYASSEGTYDVYVGVLGADAPAARLRFADRLQSLFRFEIETSEPIDATDERWRLLTIFERAVEGDASTADRLVAACSVFRFQRWVPGKGAVPLLRVCQVATLPPFRGRGHGSRLLRAVYAHAHALGAAEVTVEDPNPSFRRLRDVVDHRNCLESTLMVPQSTSTAPSAALLAAARDSLLITEEQLTRSHEMQQYVQVRAEMQQCASGEDKDAAMKPWRLLVKRRLLKLHQEDLDAPLSVHDREAKEASKGGGGSGGAAGDADADGSEAPPKPTREELVAAKKARLEVLFNELCEEYDEVIHRIERKPCTAK
jgi:GNAT superfamily N-acetyltransferase